MAGEQHRVASLCQAQPAELHLDGVWHPAAVLGWRHDGAGRCRVRVRVDVAGAPRVVWAPVELLRLPLPGVAPVHRSAAPVPRPRPGVDAGRWSPGRDAAPGRRPETWREDHPHDALLDPSEYELQALRLQVELLKLQRWAGATGQRVAVVLEGHEAAGTDGLVRVVAEHLDPRRTRVVAPGDASAPVRLSLAALPAAGELVLFDRSWYGRPAVETGTVGDLRAVAAAERLLVAGGLRLVKVWLSVTRGEQRTRLALRRDGYRLTAADLAVLDRWDAHTAAGETVLAATPTPPWTAVRANDEPRARLEAVRHVLSVLPYDGRRDDVVGTPDPLLVRPAPVAVPA
ncbi:polyphosphate kinase 2 (PPK2 family) [Geodermatophilus normandii]|uniref:Polyphosphate kinase 2 (PPK2 family) n=1 Tax=Geodermatophilus normandii TaxID=1137989 RepID=A0A317QFQ2_9ACTN|nr:polyphosphate kinase 2 [Geodermatophilus normandii]PWW21426.1 polyphosphate kinase 2 (PPK2 family) [Geodermatophilus normandii]